MFALNVPALPWYDFVGNLKWFIIIPSFMVSAVVLLLYPSARRKVALFLGAIGLFCVFLSGFAYFPYSVLTSFPKDVSVGLFVLNCGAILAAFDVVKTKINKNIASLSLVILGCIELLPFIHFAFINPDFTRWNVWIDATPYIAFLAAGVTTIICGTLSFFLGKPKNSKTFIFSLHNHSQKLEKHIQNFPEGFIRNSLTLRVG